MTSFAKASRWIISDLDELAELAASALLLKATEQKTQHLPLINALLAGRESSDEALHHAFLGDDALSLCNDACSIGCLSAAANGRMDYEERVISSMHIFMTGSLSGSSIISERSPAAMAWAWRELDPEEKNLARAMPPEMLCEWLAGSFSHPESGLPMGGSMPTVGYEMARAFGPQGVDIRRAMRAKTLVAMLKPGSRGPRRDKIAMDFCSAVAALGADNARPWVGKIKKTRFAFNAKRRAAWSLAGGVGSVIAASIAPLASPSLAAAAIPLSLGAFSMLAAGCAMMVTIPSARAASPLSKHYFGGDGAIDFVSTCYPRLAGCGLFSAWRKISNNVEVDAYKALELIGAGDARILAKPAANAKGADDSPPQLGGPNMLKADIFSAIGSEIEREALGASSNAPQASAPKPKSCRL